MIQKSKSSAEASETPAENREQQHQHAPPSPGINNFISHWSPRFQDSPLRQTNYQRLAGNQICQLFVDRYRVSFRPGSLCALLRRISVGIPDSSISLGTVPGTSRGASPLCRISLNGVPESKFPLQTVPVSKILPSVILRVVQPPRRPFHVPRAKHWCHRFPRCLIKKGRDIPVVAEA